MVLTPAPVGINPLVLAAATALFVMEVIAFVILIDYSAASVAPFDCEKTAINLVAHDLTPTAGTRY